MQINAIGASTFSANDDERSQRTAASKPASSDESRALVVIESAPATQDRPMAYRSAPFLAQLIATKAQMPQTRTRRRAEPQDATAAYRAVARLIA